MNQILIHEKVIITPEFKRKKKVYKFNFFLSVFLVCTLFSCYIYAEYDRTKSEQVSQEILLGMEEEEETTVIEDLVSVDEDKLIVKLSGVKSEVNISSLEADKQAKKLSTVEEHTASDGTKYYVEATLTIASLGIEYPVLSDSTDELLKISINKLWGPNPNEVGNYVIIGHNYKNGSMFGKLPKIKIGDTFELKDLSGRKVKYKVYDKYEIEPTDVSCTSQLTEGKTEVTLITCNSNGKKRIAVRATQI